MEGYVAQPLDSVANKSLTSIFDAAGPDDGLSAEDAAAQMAVTRLDAAGLVHGPSELFLELEIPFPEESNSLPSSVESGVAPVIAAEVAGLGNLPDLFTLGDGEFRGQRAQFMRAIVESDVSAPDSAEGRLLAEADQSVLDGLLGFHEESELPSERAREFATLVPIPGSSLLEVIDHDILGTSGDSEATRKNKGGGQDNDKGKDKNKGKDKDKDKQAGKEEGDEEADTPPPTPEGGGGGGKGATLIKPGDAVHGAKPQLSLNQVVAATVANPAQSSPIFGLVGTPQLAVRQARRGAGGAQPVFPPRPSTLRREAPGIVPHLLSAGGTAPGTLSVIAPASPPQIALPTARPPTHLKSVAIPGAPRPKGARGLPAAALKVTQVPPQLAGLGGVVAPSSGMDTGASTQPAGIGVSKTTHPPQLEPKHTAGVAMSSSPQVYKPALGPHPFGTGQPAVAPPGVAHTSSNLLTADPRFEQEPQSPKTLSNGSDRDRMLVKQVEALAPILSPRVSGESPEGAFPSTVVLGGPASRARHAQVAPMVAAGRGAVRGAQPDQFPAFHGTAPKSTAVLQPPTGLFVPAGGQRDARTPSSHPASAAIGAQRNSAAGAAVLVPPVLPGAPTTDLPGSNATRRGGGGGGNPLAEAAAQIVQVRELRGALLERSRESRNPEQSSASLLGALQVHRIVRELEQEAKTREPHKGALEQAKRDAKRALELEQRAAIRAQRPSAQARALRQTNRDWRRDDRSDLKNKRKLPPGPGQGGYDEYRRGEAIRRLERDKAVVGPLEKKQQAVKDANSAIKKANKTLSSPSASAAEKKEARSALEKAKADKRENRLSKKEKAALREGKARIEENTKVERQLRPKEPSPGKPEPTKKPPGTLPDWLADLPYLPIGPMEATPTQTADDPGACGPCFKKPPCTECTEREECVCIPSASEEAGVGGPGGTGDASGGSGQDFVAPSGSMAMSTSVFVGPGLSSWSSSLLAKTVTVGANGGGAKPCDKLLIQLTPSQIEALQDIAGDSDKRDTLQDLVADELRKAQLDIAQIRDRPKFRQMFAGGRHVEQGQTRMPPDAEVSGPSRDRIRSPILGIPRVVTGRAQDAAADIVRRLWEALPAKTLKELNDLFESAVGAVAELAVVGVLDSVEALFGADAADGVASVFSEIFGALGFGNEALESLNEIGADLLRCLGIPQEVIDSVLEVVRFIQNLSGAKAIFKRLSKMSNLLPGRRSRGRNGLRANDPESLHAQSIVSRNTGQPPRKWYRPRLRKDVRNQIFEDAIRGKKPDKNGRYWIKDPYDPKQDIWVERKVSANNNVEWSTNADIGHKVDFKHHEWETEAQKMGVTRGEFLDAINDPNMYHLESKATNRSHKFEDRRRARSKARSFFRRVIRSRPR